MGGWLELAPGQITDDTLMALALYRSIVDCQKVSPTHIKANYHEWRKITKDCGKTTAEALTFGADKAWLGSNRQAAGNGSLMRTAVLGAAQVDPKTKIANEWCAELLDTMHECDGIIPWIGELGGFEIPTGENHVGGILVGSIVEGSDAEVTADPLMFPFTEEEWCCTLTWIEEEVDFLWHEANDDEDVEGEE